MPATNLRAVAVWAVLLLIAVLFLCFAMGSYKKGGEAISSDRSSVMR